MNRQKLTLLNDNPIDCHFFDPAFAINVMTIKNDPLIDLFYTNSDHWVIQTNTEVFGFTKTKLLLNFLLKSAKNESLNRFIDDVIRLYNQSRAENLAAGIHEPLFKQIEQKFKALANLKQELEEYRI